MTEKAHGVRPCLNERILGSNLYGLLRFDW
jgi:hypothetical protein